MADSSPYNSLLKLGPHHYAELLSQEARILYFSYPAFILMPLVTKIFGGDKGIQKQNIDYTQIDNQSNLISAVGRTLVPPAIPLSPLYVFSGKGEKWRPKWLIHAGLKFSFPSVHHLIRSNGFDNVDILLIEDFRLWPLLDMVKAGLKVYHMRDDVSGFGDWHDCSESIERDIIHSVDKVIVTARKLEVKARNLGAKDIIYLPNGVDFDFFAVQTVDNIPADLHRIPSPRIIYVGTIGKWFDSEIVEYCAHSLPDCSFVLIGPNSIDDSSLRSYSNIRFLGPKSYDLIPAYLNNCDIGIIPFKKNKLTDAVCPIKLFEYMASGLQVVSTDLAETKSLKSPAFLAKDKDEFLSMIKYALDIKGKTKGEVIRFAKNNTWENRFSVLKNALRMV